MLEGQGSSGDLCKNKRAGGCHFPTLPTNLQDTQTTAGTKKVPPNTVTCHCRLLQFIQPCQPQQEVSRVASGPFLQQTCTDLARTVRATPTLSCELSHCSPVAGGF